MKANIIMEVVGRFSNLLGRRSFFIDNSLGLLKADFIE